VFEGTRVELEASPIVYFEICAEALLNYADQQKG